MMSAVRPRKAGTAAVTCAFLAARSRSPLRFVPARLSSLAVPVPVRSALNVPSTDASTWTLLALCIASTALVRISFGSEIVGPELMPHPATRTSVVTMASPSACRYIESSPGWTGLLGPSVESPCAPNLSSRPEIGPFAPGIRSLTGRRVPCAMIALGPLGNPGTIVGVPIGRGLMGGPADDQAMGRAGGAPGQRTPAGPTVKANDRTDRDPTNGLWLPGPQFGVVRSGRESSRRCPSDPLIHGASLSRKQEHQKEY